METQPQPLPLRLTKEEEITRQTLEPEFRGALSLSEWGGIHRGAELADLIAGLRAYLCADGDASRVLLSQVTVLDALFQKLTSLALSQSNLAAIEGLMKLGLRAQAQSAKTAEALASLKSPPSVYASQVNVGNAVQVNNACGPTPSQKSPNELSSDHEFRPEPRAIEEDSSVETLESLYGTQDITGEGDVVPERIQGRVEAQDA